MEIGIGGFERSTRSTGNHRDACFVHDFDIALRDGSADENAHFDLAQEVSLRST